MNSFSLGGDLAADCGEQFRLELNDSFVGSEHFLFPLAQLRRGEAFGIGERLAAFVLDRNASGVGFRNLDEVTENAIETNTQVTDTAARAFAGFEGGDDLFRVMRGRAQAVEFGGEAVADRVAVGEFYGRIVSDGSANQLANIEQFVSILGQHLEQRRIESTQHFADRRHLIQ